MRLTRVASAAAVGVLVLGAGAVAAAALFGDRLVAAAIRRAGPAVIGREVRVGGVEIDWGRYATVAATRLAVADAAWTGNPAVLRARRAEVTIDLLDLLRLRFSPVRLGLHEPALRLVRDERGRWNLPGAGGGGGAGRSGRSALSDGLAALREIEVRNGEVTVDDLALPGVEFRVTALSARMPDAGAGGIGFGGMAGWRDGTPVSFTGRTGSPAQLLRGGAGEPVPVRLVVGPDTARLSVAGHVARPLDLAGFDLRVEGQGDDLAPLLAALGAAPATATPRFRLAARLTDTERGWNLGEVSARLGGSEARGEAAVVLERRRRPRLSVDLVAPRLVPSDLDWLASIGGRRGAPAKPWADTEVPTAWLRRADAKGDLRVERLEGPEAGPADLRLGFELEDGRLRVQPFRLGLAQGAAEGAATVDAGDGGAPPLVALRLDARGLRLGPVLEAFGIGGQVAAGRLESASVDVHGRGATAREAAAALDGAARFRVVDGTLDLPGLSRLSMGLWETLGSVLGGGGDAAPVPMVCAFGDFAVRQGVAHAERLAVVTPRVVIAGEGAVRLGDATVRLTLVPKPLDEALLRVVVPVVISGPLASPEVETHPELRAGLRPDAAADTCRDESDRR